MVFSIRKNVEQQQAELNVQEVYNLWDWDATEAWTIEQFRIWKNFVHDPDLKMLCDDYTEQTENKLSKVKGLLKQFKLQGAISPRKNVYIPANTDNIFDEHIAYWVLIYAQEKLDMMLRLLRTAVTNDPLRKLILKYIKDDVAMLDKIIKRIKLRGWINQAPLYPNVPKECGENLDCGEAYHIWDHLTYRYDNLEETQTYINLAHDGDFKTLLRIGHQDILKKQTKMLEKELIKFGLPTPKATPEVLAETQNTQIRADRNMYKEVLEGMQAAAIMHAQAIKQSTTNDRLRNKVFTVLFVEELNVLNSIVKYGKLKGWLNPPPLYRH